MTGQNCSARPELTMSIMSSTDMRTAALGASYCSNVVSSAKPLNAVASGAHELAVSCTALSAASFAAATAAASARASAAAKRGITRDYTPFLLILQGMALQFTRDCPPSLLILQGRSLTAELLPVRLHLRDGALELVVEATCGKPQSARNARCVLKRAMHPLCTRMAGFKTPASEATCSGYRRGPDGDGGSAISCPT